VNPAKRAEIYARLRAANPAPTTELAYETPFQLLIAVILSAQATDKGVNLATPALFRAAPTPAKMHKLGVERLEGYIKTIGLYHSKAKHIIETCRALVEEHGGEVRKTANVVMNTAFGEPTIAVDTHIFRVSNRTGIAPGKSPREVEDRLVKFTPAEFARDAHHWLILHGRYVCKAIKPDCPNCRINDLCEFRKKTKPEPAKGKPRSFHPTRG
jgi:endonuclease III